MNEPAFEPPGDTSDDWLYEPPEPARRTRPRDRAVPFDDARPYLEWHHDGAFPGEHGGYGALRGLEPPSEWPGAGHYVPRQGDRPAWPDPYPPTPYHPASYRQGQRSFRRALAVVAILLASIAAGVGAAFLLIETAHLR